MEFRSEAHKRWWFSKMRSEGLLSSIRDRRESAYSDMWAENPAFVANVPGKVSMPSMTDQEKSEFAAYRGEFGQK